MKTKLFVFCGSVALLGVAVAQSNKKTSSDSSQRETVAKPMTEKQRKKQEDKLRKELETPYKKWLNEDVGYIISDEERTAFKRLATDDERQTFIEGFWLRRDPTPDTEENEFKEEHYRRIEYANEHYAPSDQPMRSTRIPPAAATTGLMKKAAAQRPLTRSRNGAIAISMALEPTLKSSSSTLLCPANIA